VWRDALHCHEPGIFFSEAAQDASRGVPSGCHKKIVRARGARLSLDTRQQSGRFRFDPFKIVQSLPATMDQNGTPLDSPNAVAVTS
jgi:hypothetical protein